MQKTNYTVKQEGDLIVKSLRDDVSELEYSNKELHLMCIDYSKELDEIKSRSCDWCKHEKDNIMTCGADIDRPYTYKGIYNEKTATFIKPFYCGRWEKKDVN